MHVALAVYALIRITFLKLNISYDESVAYFGFFGTIVGYNFIKYDELARVKKIKLTKTFKAIIVLSFISAIAAFYYFLELKTKTKLIGFGTLLLTILYTLPFFPHKSNMRNWSGIKIYLVAVAWVGVTVLLPVINAEFEIELLVILKCIQRFILVFVLMLIFEIIDLQNDDLKLHTIPQKIGTKNTKLLSYFLSILFFVIGLLFFMYDQHLYIKNYGCFGFDRYREFTINLFEIKIAVKNSIPQIVLLLLLLGFTYFASNKRNKYYTSFWVESVPFIWLVFLLIFS